MIRKGFDHFAIETTGLTHWQHHKILIVTFRDEEYGPSTIISVVGVPKTATAQLRYQGLPICKAPEFLRIALDDFWQNGVDEAMQRAWPPQEKPTSEKVQ